MTWRRLRKRKQQSLFTGNLQRKLLKVSKQVYLEYRRVVIIAQL